MKLLILLSSPLNQRTEWLLDSLLREVGLTQADVDVTVAGTRVPTKSTNCVLACGKRALKIVLSDWKGDPAEKRGYIWQREDGTKVVATMDLDTVSDVWVPWRVLVGKDLAKAVKESGSRELVRKERKIVVATEQNQTVILFDIMTSHNIAADIEIFGPEKLACIGFAVSPTLSYVFPPKCFDCAFELLRTRPMIWANGQFDLHFLYTRYGVRASMADDTQLAWHACYPEMAGQTNEDRKGKGNRHTRKSLSFLASIFTDAKWWKDYEFKNERERYELNGHDCCVTLDIMLQLRAYIDSMGVREIYQQEIDLVWPCVEIQARGMLVDDTLRKSRIKEIDAAIETNEDKLNAAVLPMIDAKWDKIESKALFEDKWVCPCCRGGVKKNTCCWQCAGFEKAPRLKDLRSVIANSGWKASKRVKEYAKLDGMSKAEALAHYVPACKVCGDSGKRVTRVFNSGSVIQKRVLLYTLLRLPKRHEKGKLKTDEATIKDLLAHAQDDGREILMLMLATTKYKTMRSQYQRIRPSPKDGRIRTSLNPGGTETGRLASKKFFLDESTNLQNPVKKAGAGIPLFQVRSCFIADPNRVLCEVDYSSAERRLLAYLAKETEALRQIEQGINSYKWFGGQLFNLTDWESMSKKDPLYHIAKTSVLGLDRGVSWGRLMEAVNKDADITGASITAKEAKKAVGLFHEIYPGYRKYFDKIEAEILRTGALTNICGRRRDFFGRKGKSGIASVTREGVSFMAQAIGDVINGAMVRIYREADPDLLRLLLQVHDALLFDCAPEDMDAAFKLVVGEMEKPIMLPGGREIVIPAEASWTRTNWAEMEDYHG